MGEVVNGNINFWFSPMELEDFHNNKAIEKDQTFHTVLGSLTPRTCDFRAQIRS